jgi:nucleoside-diphosphate-sugar epimerase
MTTAFVTGANGFIGSHLVRELLHKGYEVRCLIRRTSDLSALDGLKLILFEGDILESDTLEEPMKGVEYVYHLAAELMVTSRQEFEEANIQGTINMLEAATNFAANTLKRFLFVSSQSAVGPGINADPIVESRQPAPISWYGNSKEKAEKAVKDFGSRLPVTIVRPSVVYGEREKDLSQVYTVLSKRIQPKLGIKKKYLVMVYVSDLVKGMIQAAESNKTLNQTYFMNHTEILTSKTVIKTMAQAMKKECGVMLPVPLLVIRIAAPFAELLYHITRNRAQMTRDKAREVRQRFWVASAAKAKNDFGWEAEHHLLDGMKKTIPHFLGRLQKLREMPLESGFIFWLKYAVIASILGAIIEVTSYIGQFYVFNVWWLIVVVIFGVYGLLFGTCAMLTRKARDSMQFIVGTVLAGAGEILNDIAFHLWTFKSAWPFGITNSWIRSIVLSLVGGIFILLVNQTMIVLYKRRLRFG